jgi:hypothetical protein
VLKGKELLDLVKAMPNATKSELVRAAGYLSYKKDGSERLNFTAFYAALLEAQGLPLGAGEGKPIGRKLSFMATVQFNGNLMIGKSYMRQMGAKPGDQFQLVLNRNSGALRLVPMGQDVSDAGPGAPAEEPVAAVRPAPQLAAVA